MSSSTTATSKPPKRRQAVVVLGMHRSGTSALAGVLERLGCVAPASQLPSSDQNPRGFFESREIAGHNDLVLDSAGSNWRDWRPLNPGWIDSPPVHDLADDAVQIIADEFGDAPLIVLKDPRMCRLVDYWRLVLEKAGIEPLFIHIHRNPAEVASSLEQRNHFDSAFGMLLWLRHVLDAEAGSRGRARMFVSFERLLQNWSGVTKQAQDSLELTFPRLSDRTALEIEDFLSADLRHHTLPADQILSNPMVSDWIRDSFDILERWSRRGAEENVDYAELDRIRAYFNGATPAFSRFAMAGEHAVQKSRTTQAYVQAARDETSSARAGADRAHQKADRLDEELRQREAEIEDANKQAETAQKDLKNRYRELGELALLLAETEAHLTTIKAEHEEETNKRTAQIKKLRDEIDVLNANIAKRKSQAAEQAARARDAIEKYEGILATTSWRITAPIRKIVDLLRGS